MERPTSDSASARRDWWWIFDPRESLRARAALCVGAGTLAVTMLLSWITGTVFQRALEAQLGGQFESMAFQLSDKLDRTIYERYRTLQLGANLALLKNDNVPPVERRRALEALQESSPEFAWIGLVDAAGHVVAATGGLFERSDVSSRPWFLTGRDHPFVGSLHEIPDLAREVVLPSDTESSGRFLDLAVPVTNANGNLVGVLAAHLRWGWTRDVQLSVVSESAFREHIGVTLYSAAGEVLLDSGASGWTQPPERPPISEGRRFRGAMFERIAGGTNYLTGYARSRGFREYHGIGWLTVVRQPVKHAFESVESLQRSISVCGAVVAVMAGLAGWIAVSRHARRLRLIGAAAGRIREGDILTVLPPPTGQSEMAGMCQALGDLVEDLRGKNESLSVENARLRRHVREGDAAKRER